MKGLGSLAKPGTGANAKATLVRWQEMYNERCPTRSPKDTMVTTCETTLRGRRRCDDAFAKAAIPSPLVQHSWYSVQMAIICTAITNLIK
uniref:Uncharacterized protein n=1 Tax=Oryza punctata TaxID=4537 RepID=A0A0E0K0N9_ORYPU